jgi:hypothetical protein
MGTCCPQPVKFTLDYFSHLHYTQETRPVEHEAIGRAYRHP